MFSSNDLSTVKVLISKDQLIKAKEEKFRLECSSC